MSLIKTNHKEAQGGFELLPKGNYEVFIEGGLAKVTAKGSPMISWKLNIRNDVDQPGGGRKLFTNLVIQENTAGMVQGFLKGIGSPDGAEYADTKALIDFATGRATKVSVKVSEWNGQDRNEVGYFMESEVGGGTAAKEDPFAQANQGPIEVSDEDLPF